ncbi:hypothetical protein JDV02_002294 [Purpureocillium takamizusanense]|uniref:Major facilitator superfamily (MFS) profile domain-containing protein n=1 Tax=Purpureocillium takamizusanense TaxID=2060973 RepID=A0A9Q8QAS0_9HYPO|nr:uncharacterized protein JDV02_002294 [Purpureocillium takamizusanense]UNI15793.1 hypothetical protein JDV02_002294 [Purpureocillium takamizusanense]
MQLRQAMFLSASSFAGAFGGLLAFGIVKMDGIGGLEGWRWIFIVEGIVTVAVAVLACFCLYDFPETAKFLTEEERAFVVHRLRYQGQTTTSTQDGVVPMAVSQAEEFKCDYIWQAFKDWHVWISILMGWGVSAELPGADNFTDMYSGQLTCPLFGLSLFLPTIIRALGYTSSKAQLMTVPIYTMGAILSLVSARCSDRVGKRSPFLLGCMTVMVLGFSMCIASGDPKVVYGGVFIATCGVHSASPGSISWMSNNLAGGYKRSVGMAIYLAGANLGGVVASNLYRAKDGPRYVMGHGIAVGFEILGMVAVVILIMGYHASNRRRERLLAEGAAARFTPEELSAQGDKAVTFRYML